MIDKILKQWDLIFISEAPVALVRNIGVDSWSKALVVLPESEPSELPSRNSLRISSGPR